MSFSQILLAEEDMVIDGNVDEIEQEVERNVAAAEDEAKDLIKNNKVESYIDKPISSHIQFDYGQFNGNILHEETSTDSAFEALGEDSNIVVHLVGLAYEYEVFSRSLISLTAHLGAGFQTGEDVQYDQGDSGQFDYEDRVFGYYGSGGLSLNFNRRRGYRNTQFFVGARSIKAVSTYFLRYNDDTSTTRSTEIEYDLDQTVVETSIGVRFFEYGKKNLYSMFSINQLSFTTNSLDGSASAGDTDYKLLQTARFKYQDYSLRLAFGVVY